MTKNPYDVLGIPRDSTMDTVKTAYKKLVMKWHPDKNAGDPNAEEKIREINAAYDEIKKPKPNNAFNPHSFEDYADLNDWLNSNFFSNFGFSTKPRAKNVQVQYNMTLEEAYEGKEASFTYKIPQGTKTIKIKIPAGILDGETLRCSGQGYSLGDGSPPSDLLIMVRLHKHKDFDREGIHLIHRVEIPVFDAIIGTTIKIPVISGGTIDLPIPKATQPNTTFKLTGYGMPRANVRGDMFVEVKVVIPDLNDTDIEKVKTIKNQL